MAHQIAELKAWQVEQDALDRQEIAWFDDLLEAYYRRLEADGKVRYGEKSYLLPNGRRLGYRLAEASWQVTDPEALFGWAKGKGYVRVKAETDWQDQVKPRLVALEPNPGAAAVDRDSGEVIPGVILERPVGDAFVVSVARRRRVGGIEPLAQSFGDEHTGER